MSFLCATAGFPQTEKDSVKLARDTSSVLEMRSIKEDLGQKYSGPEFNYDVKDGEAQNLLERFLKWFFDLLADTFGFNVNPGVLKILEYIIYVLMGALAIYFLVKFLIRENMSSIFTKKSTAIIDIDLSSEHIEKVDLDAMIRAALDQRDYRLAVRYQYLRVLKVLSQKSLIDWHYEKTNSDYKREIEAPRIRSLFEEVSYLYDYIWYGEQSIDEAKYKKAQTRFVALRNLLPE
ncbi:DUF4129 domain-containing protein [Flavobacteriaceae bacterium 3-367]|uniref:DUF4129 domain-containing protein n=1 Tax=Eudoraea algarum TaxID=3417568 RepID=UPI003272274A